MAAKKTEAKDPSKHTLVESTVFSVTGSFSPTDFRFHQADENTLRDLLKQAPEKGVSIFRRLPSVLVHKYNGYVGTNSSCLPPETADGYKDQVYKRKVANPGVRDIARLDGDKEFLVVVGNIRFVANFFEPNNSDCIPYTEYLANFVQRYIADGQMPGLIRRYLENIVNGRVLWRNKYGLSRKTVITLKTPEKVETFILASETDPAFNDLVAKVATTAMEPKGFLLLEVAICVELGADAEVYPSQPFFSESGKKDARPVEGDNTYSRVLAARQDANGDDQVILTSNKIGNALRTVDCWYAEGSVEPIPIELYGTVFSRRQTYRGAQSSYFDIVKSKSYDTMTEAERHFVMAAFIKGGLFGFSKG